MIRLLHQLRHAFLPALLLAATGAQAAGLPDTGQDTCYTDNVADSVAASSPGSVAADGGTHPRQDCRFGLDPAAASATPPVKIGGGAKGFDYTPLDASGSVINLTGSPPIPSTTPVCTRDNITGLTWEVKTATATDLRYSGHIYSWFSTAGTTNGGNAGSAGANTCNATLPGNLCNTEAFVTAVNAAGLCSHNDWRLPTSRELSTLVHFGVKSLSIDTNYFPNTPAVYFWSASSYLYFPGYAVTYAWTVNFFNGSISADSKTNNHSVRLVRGGTF